MDVLYIYIYALDDNAYPLHDFQVERRSYGTGNLLRDSTIIFDTAPDAHHHLKAIAQNGSPRWNKKRHSVYEPTPSLRE